ncbi:hypothetical protein [Pontibacter sp. SGAir0037]|uniref:hypothetical protein n=1 Tax=Pontibacter sp. SGAir0037 TaxID=2571030 RepID=UPI0010CCF791|nr:hypothetical protein [Pontibacter sp. SGAir0037]QCR23787.1 hypothetical protein C1N53_16475 [Pontibacter sp. SGAir0037]
MEKYNVGGLIQSDFEHIVNLNDFFTTQPLSIYSKVNMAIYDELNMIRVKAGFRTGFWEPLNFFNTLYDQFYIIMEYYLEPYTVLGHLYSLELDTYQLAFLFSSLSKFQVIQYSVTESATTEEIEQCKQAMLFMLFLVGKECDRLWDFIQEGQNDKSRYAYTFELTEPVLEHFTTLQEKINFLHSQIDCCEQEVAQAPEKFTDNGRVYIERCLLKIKYFKRLMAEENKTYTVDRGEEQLAGEEYPPKEDPSFEWLFRDKGKISPLIKALQARGCLDKNESWIDEPTHIVRLYTALLDAKRIKEIKLTPLGRIFCKRFKIEPKAFSDRTARTRVYDDIYDEFFKLSTNI